PSRADRETPLSTSSGPNLLCRFSMCMASAAVPLDCRRVAFGAASSVTACILRTDPFADASRPSPIHEPETLKAGWTGPLAVVNPQCVWELGRNAGCRQTGRKRLSLREKRLRILRAKRGRAFAGRPHGDEPPRFARFQDGGHDVDR